MKPSEWWKNKKDKVLVFEANLEEGLLTWKDEESGQEVCKDRNKAICQGTWHFFVTLSNPGTKIQLV